MTQKLINYGCIQLACETWLYSLQLSFVLFCFFFFSEFKGQFFREDYLLEQLIYKGQITAQFFQSCHLTLPYICSII